MKALMYVLRAALFAIFIVPHATKMVLDGELVPAVLFAVFFGAAICYVTRIDD